MIPNSSGKMMALFIPELTAGLGSPFFLSGGSSMTAGCLKQGVLWTWGDNQYGTVGDYTMTNRSSPVQVVGNHLFVFVAAWKHFAALKADGSVWCWGRNNYGQIGNQATSDRSSPVVAVGSHSFIRLDTGDFHTVALKANGEAWCWGYNDGGQPWTGGRLGDLSKLNRSSPVKVVGSHSFIQIAAGVESSHGLKADGTVWSWGDEYYGQLGIGIRDSRSSPVQVVGSHSFVKISAGAYNCGGLKADGSIWMWGENDNGECGDGTKDGGSPAGRSSPVKVIGNHSFVDLQLGYSFAAARKSDGSVWTWGYNSSGYLGDGTTSGRSSPVKVIGNHSFIWVSAGICGWGLKSSGQVFAWGYNTVGSVGDLTTSNRSSPVLVVKTFR